MFETLNKEDERDAGVFYEDLVVEQAKLIEKTDFSNKYYKEWLEKISPKMRRNVDNIIKHIVPYVWLRYSAGYEVSFHKEDDSYVTDVNADINEKLTQFFNAMFDDVDIVSSNTNITSKDKRKENTSDFYVCFDAVDGTHNMMMWGFDTCEDFNTTIAIVEKGKPIVGVLINHSRAIVCAKGAKCLLIKREPLEITGIAPVCHMSSPELFSTNNVRAFNKKSDVPGQNVRITGCTSTDLLNCIFGRTKRTCQFGVCEEDFRACQLIASEFGIKTFDVEPKKKKNGLFDVFVQW